MENNFYGVEGVAHKFPQKAEKGLARISKFDFCEERDFVQNLRIIRDNGRMFKMRTGTYVRLVVDGELMMSDSPMERVTNVGFIRQAEGRVFIAGLGIGMVLNAILNKPEVSEVVILEKYQDVIDLVHPQYEHSKLTVICGDVFSYDMPKKEKFDCIYFDIWPDIGGDNYKYMKLLHAKYRKNKASKDSYISSWLYEECRQLYKQYS